MPASPPEMPTSPPEMPTSRSNVLLISADPVGEEMAGVAIRFSELARAISAHTEVTLAHGGTAGGRLDGVRLLPFRPHSPGALRAAIAGADMVIAHPQWPLITRWLRTASGQVVFDLYDPETFETFETLRARPKAVRRALTDTTIDRLHDALRSGDRFVCASEKQRDLWLGAALALRLIDPAVYDRDPSLRSVIDVVPFGLPSSPRRASDRDRADRDRADQNRARRASDRGRGNCWRGFPRTPRWCCGTGACGAGLTLSRRSGRRRRSRRRGRA